jgi:hypothetical protein
MLQTAELTEFSITPEEAHVKLRLSEAQQIQQFCSGM